MAQCILIRENEAAVLADTGPDGVVEFEKSLQSGYLLALLARILGGSACDRRIYEVSPAALPVGTDDRG